MTTNYYTLFHIAVELDREFSARTIDKIFTQHQSELIISFLETQAVILIGCDPSKNYIYARKSFDRARRNSVNLFDEIAGSTIEKIFIHPDDREIHFCLNNEQELAAQMFGSKANVFLIGSAGNIVKAFLKKETKNSKIESSAQIHQTPTPGNLFLTFTGQPLEIALKKMFPQFGTVIIQELLFRTGYEGEQSVAGLKETELERILNLARQLKGELLASPSPCVYFDGALPVRFSIIHLQHLDKFRLQKFESVSEAIQIYLAQIYHEKTVFHEKEEIRKMLERELDHINRAMQKIVVETGAINRGALYERYGKLLMGQLHLLKKGDDVGLVEDLLNSSNELIEIPLNPHLTPSKNAERYFEKAKQARRSEEEQHRRAMELTRQRISICQLLEQVYEIVTTDDLHSFAEKNRVVLSEFGVKIKSKSGHLKKNEPLPFRVFKVAGDFQVWAGKSGENNDLLSTRHTAKNDLWFHVRGISGSHVVLKVGTGKGEVSKQAIEQAAAIAAYYSKMKKSKLVPVTMCEGKFVRKPKGAPAGTVIVEREKTIFIEPGLPAV